MHQQNYLLIKSYLIIKTLLRLLVSSSSLVALLLFTNSALAVTPVVNSPNQIASPAVSLNVDRSTLQLHTNFYTHI